jgi:hypothetical protein
MDDTDEAIGLGKTEAGAEPEVGVTIWTWCGVCWVRTAQVWDGKRWWCLECYPGLINDPVLGERIANAAENMD